MTNKNNETKMKFDYSVSTEDRFALRRFLEPFLAVQNFKIIDGLKTFLSDNLIVEGFTSEALNKKQFVDFIKQEKEAGNLMTINYPDLKIVFKDAAFMCSGSFHGYADNIMSYEGNIEFEIMKLEKGFTVDFIKFYPRFMLRK